MNIDASAPAVKAIAPELVAIVQAAMTMVTNFGSDPTKLGLTAGPALGIFLNTVVLQAVPAVNAEWSVAQADAIAKLGQLLTKIQPTAAAAK